MTAEEFYKDNIGIYDSPCEMMVAFAKMCCKEQVEEICQNVEADVGMFGEFGGINRDSIRNAYPLDKIK